jgi:hypothetical protein
MGSTIGTQDCPLRAALPQTGAFRRPENVLQKTAVRSKKAEQDLYRSFWDVVTGGGLDGCTIGTQD